MNQKATARLPDAALERLLSQKEGFVRFVERRVGSRSVAEDIVQAAFVRSLERGESLRDEESVVAWVYRMLRNAVVDHFRSSASHDRAMEAFSVEVQRTLQPPQSTEKEICTCITGLLAELSPGYRQALQLVEIDERPLSELACEARISSSNAAVRLHRARQALLKQIRKTCGSCADHQCMDCDCRKQS